MPVLFSVLPKAGDAGITRGELYHDRTEKLDKGFLVLINCPFSAEWHRQDPEQSAFPAGSRVASVCTR